MKSTSFEVPNSLVDKMKQNKTYDFVNFYKSTAETSVKVAKQKSDDGSSKKNVVSNKLHTPKRVPNKKKNKAQNDSVDISKMNINGDSLPHATEGSSLDDSKATSTPKAVKAGAEPKVKSIIKNKSLIDNSLNVSNINISNKPKKRNKSVSFMLDDTEGVVIKKSKSEESISKLDKSLGKTKKSKKKLHSEKENKGDTSNMAIDIVPIENVATTSKPNIHNNIETAQSFSTTDSIQKKEKLERKKQNKLKKDKNVTIESENSDLIKSEGEETKIKKTKKKKRHIKSVGTDNTGAEGEPAQKSSKKHVKPDKIAQDLESLNIGDNAHTLTNLLDEMTVVDKNKKKKNKKDKERKQEKDKLLNASSTNSEGENAENKKKHKSKKQKIDKANTDNVPVQSTNTDSEGLEEKEKVKWVKRKWNKDKKGGANVDKHLTSVIIENLPLALMFTYRKLLAEHFGKFGMIRQVGIAETHPTAEPKPVFTTSINFYSEDAAEKALEDDNTVLEGARIRVKRPLPPTLTTLVVRSYTELTEQALSSMFSGAGRIRNMRLLVKGKKSLSTAFIEFDGPKSVERAIDMAEDARIGGKKVHVAKFELRAANKKMKKDKTHTDNEGSDNSNE